MEPHAPLYKWDTLPTSLNDVHVHNRVLEYGAQLDANHPGFNDPVYRKRRAHIAHLADTCTPGMALPHVAYNNDETRTWSHIYSQLTSLFPTYACEEFNQAFESFHFSEHRVPQLEEVSKHLSDCTGWTLRPVSGLLASRDFLAGLAFKCFFSTQYIRHHSQPLYTPEPDICHELIGHIPMLANPDFAAFSEEIGKASLGVSEQDLERLSRLYWYTVEFGLIQQGPTLKAYGAGLLSSYGELQHACTGQASTLVFNPWEACERPYPITTYQPVLYVVNSLAEATEKLRAFAASLQRQQ
jgi:phenylalanine-4-hydroxylase